MLSSKIKNPDQQSESTAGSPLSEVKVAAYEWSDRRPRKSLPIDEHLPRILELMEMHQVVVVKGALGSGKSLRLAQAITLNESSQSDYEDAAKTYLTQTRRAALRWIGSRICNEMGTQPGELVGWSLTRQEPLVSAETKLQLMMTQSLNNKIVSNKGVLLPGNYIIDEVDENSIDMALLIGLLRHALPQSPGARVVMTSGTFNTKEFSAFFGDAPIVSIPEQNFEVSIRPRRLLSNEHHTEGATAAALECFEQFIDDSLLINGECITSGTIIVLLPGKRDLKAVEAALHERASQLNSSQRLETSCIHSESPPETQDSVQREIPEGVIRFVIGTEVLRTSVTVPNTVGVIDSLQVKRLICDERGVRQLKKVPVSAREATQGAGRTGRQCSGFYIPVSFQSEYESLAAEPKPITHLAPLEGLILQAAESGIALDELTLLHPAPQYRWSRTIQLLQHLGALDSEAKITDLGSQMAHLPIEPRSAVSLLKASASGILPETIVAVSVLASGSPFAKFNRADHTLTISADLADFLLDSALKNPSISNEDYNLIDDNLLPSWMYLSGNSYSLLLSQNNFPDDRSFSWLTNTVREYWAAETQSDFAASVNAFRGFAAAEREILQDSPQLSARQRRELLEGWCLSHGLHYQSLQRVRDTADELVRAWPNSRGENLERQVLTSREFSSASLTTALVAGHFDFIGVQRGAKNQYVGPLTTFKLDRHSTCPGNSPLILTTALEGIVMSHGHNETLKVAHLAAPLDKEILQRVVPQHYQIQNLINVHYKRDLDLVIGTEIHRFLSLEISREQLRVLDIETAQSTFSGWLLANAPSLTGELGDILRRNLTIINDTYALETRFSLTEPLVPKDEEYHKWVIEHLGKACRLADIQQVNNLLLPAIDIIKNLFNKLSLDAMSGNQSVEKGT